MTVTIDTTELRKSLGGFLTGITVVATLDDDGAPHGFTANSFTSVSLDPPLVLFCIAPMVSSYSVFRASDDFAISVLARHQRDVARVFSTRSSRRFARIDWRRDITGSPIIDGAASWFDCRVNSRQEVGDHLIIVGEVLAFGHCATIPPLGYLRGDYVEASRIDGLTKTKVPSPVWELQCMTGFGV